MTGIFFIIYVLVLILTVALAGCLGIYIADKQFEASRYKAWGYRSVCEDCDNVEGFVHVSANQFLVKDEVCKNCGSVKIISKLCRKHKGKLEFK